MSFSLHIRVPPPSAAVTAPPELHRIRLVCQDSERRSVSGTAPTPPGGAHSQERPATLPAPGPRTRRLGPLRGAHAPCRPSP